MKTKWATGFVLGFFLTANAFGAERPSQATLNNEPATITIGVYDYTRAKPDVLLKAERSAAAILLKAGVEAVWLACLSGHGSPKNPVCAAPADPTHLTLLIVPDCMSKHLGAVHDDALGFAEVSMGLSRTAWVLYERVRDFALKQQLTDERLLGAVIAHELGHLLLGENAHAAAGLMHGYWPRPELLAIEFGQLVFSDTESRRIQRGVAARREAVSAAMAELSTFGSLARLN